METEMKTQHKTLGEMLLSGDFAKTEETIIDGKYWQQVLDEAGYGFPDSDKPTQPKQQQEITGGLLGNLIQQNPQTKQPIDSIFNALRSIAKNN
jgi:hypothetical protein